MKLPQYRLLKISQKDHATLEAEWVDIVTCKECVHNGEYTDCPLNGYAKTDDSFCSYGEREGE